MSIPLTATFLKDFPLCCPCSPHPVPPLSALLPPFCPPLPPFPSLSSHPIYSPPPPRPYATPSRLTIRFDCSLPFPYSDPSCYGPHSAQHAHSHPPRSGQAIRIHHRGSRITACMATAASQASHSNQLIDHPCLAHPGLASYSRAWHSSISDCSHRTHASHILEVGSTTTFFLINRLK